MELVGGYLKTGLSHSLQFGRKSFGGRRTSVPGGLGHCLFGTRALGTAEIALCDKIRAGRRSLPDRMAETPGLEDLRKSVIKKIVCERNLKIIWSPSIA
jgi:hypothetical protein